MDDFSRAPLSDDYATCHTTCGNPAGGVAVGLPDAP